MRPFFQICLCTTSVASLRRSQLQKELPFKCSDGSDCGYYKTRQARHSNLKNDFQRQTGFFLLVCLSENDTGKSPLKSEDAQTHLAHCHDWASGDTLCWPGEGPCAQRPPASFSRFSVRQICFFCFHYKAFGIDILGNRTHSTTLVQEGKPSNPKLRIP